LIAWRNDPDVRIWSRNENEITLADHQTWFEGWTSPDHSKGYLYMIEVSGNSAGMVRFDKSKSEVFEISVLVDPKFQKRGVAETAIRLASSEVLRLIGDFTAIAFVHSRNLPSIKLFGRLKFDKIGESEEFLEFRREFTLKNLKH
jgi:RimJ/RimL family protein N-acetyltransferase